MGDGGVRQHTDRQQYQRLQRAQREADADPASTGVFGRIYLNQKLIYEHFVAGTDGVGVNYSVAAR
jgi:hypothetical protein